MHRVAQAEIGQFAGSGGAGARRFAAESAALVLDRSRHRDRREHGDRDQRGGQRAQLQRARLGAEPGIEHHHLLPIFLGHARAAVARSAAAQGTARRNGRRNLAQLPHVEAAAASLRIFHPELGAGSANVRRGDMRAKNVILQGNPPAIAKIFDFNLERGRWFNETDEEHRSPVAVIGHDTAETLFPTRRRSHRQARFFSKER